MELQKMINYVFLRNLEITLLTLIITFISRKIILILRIYIFLLLKNCLRLVMIILMIDLVLSLVTFLFLII